MTSRIIELLNSSMQDYGTVFQSPVGPISIISNQNGITCVEFGNKADGMEKNQFVKSAEEQLEMYFAGELNTFDLPLDPDGTEFQKSVWESLQSIPYGKTMSYKELSIKLGDVKAIRAVGTANGANPIAIVIPCHRVIGSNGELTGYAGGLSRKKFLLDLEQPVTQTTLF